MIRTFIAVDVSPEVKQRASDLIQQCRQLNLDAKWVAVENMHLTLQFLGNVRENDLPMICRALDDAVRSFTSFDVVCRGVGAFPSADRPRVIWVGMEQGREELVALQSAVEGAMKGIGFRSESRRFEPHLTVGRIRAEASSSPRLAEFIAAQQDYEASVFDVSEVVVYSSELQKSGPKYEVIGRVELAY